MRFSAQHLVLLFIAAALCSSILFKGHDTPRFGEVVAFSHGSRVVKITGDHPLPGIYFFQEGISTEDVINMTLKRRRNVVADKNQLSSPVVSGDVIQFAVNSDNGLKIIRQKMNSRDLMLLGIPLQPDQMSLEDWESLPGIGAVMAERIIIDRQINGDFGSLEAIKRVSGIGDKTISRIRHFF